MKGGYEAFSSCIYNACEDKVKFCARYGISIKKGDWPVYHLPTKLVCDRGKEFVGYNLEKVCEDLRISIDLLPPFRPDLKGIVEKSFDLVQSQYKPAFRGAGVVETDLGERGAPNYHLGATLTLRDFTHVVIETVLYVNNDRRRDDVILPIQDKTPRGIWNSREPDKTLRSMPKEELLIALLPKGEASITKYGVRFKGAFYHSKHFFERMVSARINGNEKITISYCTDDMSRIYYCDNGRYEALLLTSRMRQYEALSYDELELIIAADKQAAAEFERHEVSATVELNKKLDAISKKAAERKELMLGGYKPSNAEAMRSMKNNRKKEMGWLKKND